MTRWKINVNYETSGGEPFHFTLKNEWTSTRTGIFGQSGAGKSTFFELLLGLRPASQVLGSIQVDQEIIHDSEKNIYTQVNKRNFAWVPQDSGLFPHLNVERNIKFGQSPGAVDDGSFFSKVTETLEVQNLLAQRPGKLSGGEKQRVALARAIFSGRKILLLDEPLAALDKTRRHAFSTYISRVTEEFKLSFIYVSHDWDEIEFLCDHVLIFRNGQMIASGTPEGCRSHETTPASS